MSRVGGVLLIEVKNGELLRSYNHQCTSAVGCLLTSNFGRMLRYIIISFTVGMTIEVGTFTIYAPSRRSGHLSPCSVIKRELGCYNTCCSDVISDCDIALLKKQDQLYNYAHTSAAAKNAIFKGGRIIRKGGGEKEASVTSVVTLCIHIRYLLHTLFIVCGLIHTS